MKNKNVVLVVFALFLSCASIRGECDGEVIVRYEFKPTEGPTYTFTDYDYPEYQEDVSLMLSWINVSNSANCTLPKSIIQFTFVSKSENILRYGPTMPELKQGEVYSIRFVNFTYTPVKLNTIPPSTIYVREINYLDSNGNITTLASTGPLNIGLWTINANFTEKHETREQEQFIYIYLSENNHLAYYNPIFKVLSKLELKANDISDKALNVSRLALFVSASTFIFSFLTLLISYAAKKSADMQEKKLQNISDYLQELSIESRTSWHNQIEKLQEILDNTRYLPQSAHSIQNLTGSLSHLDSIIGSVLEHMPKSKSKTRDKRK